MTVRIGRNFHVVHMTGDLKELDAWYYDVFSVQRFMPDNYMPHEVRDASLVVLGDLCLEPLAPAFRVEGWDAMPLGRFYRRFGKRLHSLAWYVDEGFDELYARLHDAGVRMLGTGGVKQEGAGPQGAVFTHPRDTCTQLEFIPTPEPDSPWNARDPRFVPRWTPKWWAQSHPLHIERFSCATVSARDVDAARNLYVDVLGGTLLHEADDDMTRTRNAYVLVGDLVVNFAQPVDPTSPIAQDMEQHGESLVAMTFEVADLASAEEHLLRKGVKLAITNGSVLVTDPETSQGAVMVFTTNPIPGDPRPTWSDGGGLPGS
jgi:catechol 2,3-dioxygenase-like lactoylglutathione lyase family enzyme